MKIKLQHLELGWHVIALTLLSGAFVPLWRQTYVGGELAQDPFQQVVLLVSYSGLILLGWHHRHIGRLLMRGWSIWMVVGLAYISVLWSLDPAITLRRSIALLLATLYGFLLAIRYPFLTVLKLLGTAMSLIVIASLISIVSGFGWAVMDYPHPGAWQGIMFHKNALGRIAALALIVFVTLSQQHSGWWRLSWYGLSLGAVILIIGSQSITALVVTTLVVTAWLTLTMFYSLASRERWQMTALVFATILPISTLGSIYWPEIVSLIGRDPTLTGRLPLWQSLIGIGIQHPLLGYGFGAFWIDPSQMLSLDIALMRLRFWWAKHAHNGYIDVWLELGLVGLMLILTTLLTLMIKNFHHFFQEKSYYKFLFITIFLFYLITYNFSEVILAESSLGKAIFWITFSYAYYETQINV
jgi:O-antigen ligase